MSIKREALARVLTDPFPPVQWRSPGRTFRLWRRAIRVTSRAMAQYGGNWVSMTRLARELLGRDLYNKEEILQLGLLDPKLTDDDRGRFLSREAAFRLERFLNSEAARRFVEDKGLFYRRCPELGLPVPQLWGIYSTRGAIQTADGRDLRGHPACATFLTEECPGDLVLKPTTSGYGTGVTVLHRESAGQFRDPAGILLTPEEALNRLDHEPISGSWIIQERIYNHPELVALSRSPYLQTIRFFTMVDGVGRAHVIEAHFKLIVGKNHIDNFHYGATGNLVAGADLASGRLSEAWTTRGPKGGFVPVTEHPGSGNRIKGFQLPEWESATELAIRAATAFRPLRFVGWDVALTPAGPVLVEGNWNSDPPNSTGNSGRLLAWIEKLM